LRLSFYQSARNWFGLPEKALSSRSGGVKAALIVAVGTICGYFAVNELAAIRGVSVFDPTQLFVLGDLTIDSRIPYLPWTVMIYKWYGTYFLLPVLFYPKTVAGVRELFGLYTGMISLAFICYALFLLFPVEMTLRVDVIPEGSSPFFHEMNRVIHSIDRPFNTWPSMHVALPGLATMVMGGWLKGRFGKALIYGCWIAMSISTLTTKQHFLWDVLTGGLLAGIYWRCLLRKSLSEVEGKPDRVITG